MFYLSVVLLVIGVLAILLELLMPGFDGFISGIVGVLALVASAVLAVIMGGWLVVGACLVVLAATTVAFFVYIRKKHLHGNIVMTDTLAEDTDPIDFDTLRGKTGETVTRLRPYGEADFDGVRVEVSSSGALIESGTKVRVVNVEASKIMVKAVDN